MPRTYVAVTLLLGTVAVGGVIELALARSSAHDGRESRWLRWPSRDTAWEAHLTVVDRALAGADVSTAVRAWHDAYGAALASDRWEALVEVGDAFLRIGDGAASPVAGRINARQAYLAALMRAQRHGSADGVRRVARAFEALGDHAVAAQCARIASRLTERGGERPG